MIGKNNPYNIRYSHRNQWLGLSNENPSTKGFCNFIDRSYGIRAACYLLMRSYRIKRCVSIADIIERFAPSSENDSKKYIHFVAERSGVFNIYVGLWSLHQYVMVLHAMSIYEGNCVSYEDIVQVIDRFKIKLYEK